MFRSTQTGRVFRRFRAQVTTAATLAAMGAIAQSAMAQTTTIISDNFTSGTPGNTLVGGTPDTTNVPGSSYQLNGAITFGATYFNDGTNAYASVGADTGAGLATGVTATVVYQVQITFNNNFIGDTAGTLQRGEGLGFFTTLSSGYNGYHGVGNFTGVVVSPAGDVRLEVVGPQGTNEPSVNEISDYMLTGYDNTANHVLSYTANTSSGLISNVVLDGSTIPLTDTTPLFTPGNTSFVGFTASGNAGGQTALFKGFSVSTTPIQGTIPATVWNIDASGNWNTASNWTLGTPNAIGAEADLTSVITANRDIYTETSITVGKLVFNNSNASYEITGALGASLSLQTSSGSAVVDVQAGTHEINLPLILVNNTTFQTDSSTAKLIIADPLTIDAGMKLNTSGSGTVTYLSTVTLQNGATASLAGQTTANALSLATGALVTINNTSGGSHSAVTITSLNLSTGATVDVRTNDLIIHGGTSLGTVRGEVAAGYNGGKWNGSGIVSTNAAADTAHLTAVGVRQTTVAGTIDGTAYSAGDVLIKYTYYGDANLDGHVDGSDYSLVDAAAIADKTTPGSVTGWSNGDFNYDGTVNGSDYTLMDNAFNMQGTSKAFSPSAQVAAQTAAVPEPASLALAGLGALALRRRRQV